MQMLNGGLPHPLSRLLIDDQLLLAVRALYQSSFPLCTLAFILRLLRFISIDLPQPHFLQHLRHAFCLESF